MEHIEVLGREIVNREENERAQPDKTDMLRDPPHVIVQGVLEQEKHEVFKTQRSAQLRNTVENNTIVE